MGIIVASILSVCIIFVLIAVWILLSYGDTCCFVPTQEEIEERDLQLIFRRTVTEEDLEINMTANVQQNVALMKPI